MYFKHSPATERLGRGKGVQQKVPCTNLNLGKARVKKLARYVPGCEGWLCSRSASDTAELRCDVLLTVPRGLDCCYETGFLSSLQRVFLRWKPDVTSPTFTLNFEVHACSDYPSRLLSFIADVVSAQLSSTDRCTALQAKNEQLERELALCRQQLVTYADTDTQYRTEMAVKVGVCGIIWLPGTRLNAGNNQNGALSSGGCHSERQKAADTGLGRTAGRTG